VTPNKKLPAPALLLASLAVLASVPAMAQTPKARPDPADARAPVAPLTYKSSLAQYRKPDAEAPPLAWRDANDAVERIGGWRAYAREAAAAPAAPASAPASAPAGQRR
jgi:hypothetical protein